MIPGEPLWRENFKTLTSSIARKKIAFQIAEFLHELHHFSAYENIPVKLPEYDTPQEWADLYSRIQDKLYAYMRPDARQQIALHFEGYIDNPGRYEFVPRLRHGDFGTGNILYDPKTLSIVGVIDFGGIGLGDPASDFAGLFISYGEDFYRQCGSFYPDLGTALDRVHFYCGTFALQEALFGVENGDDAAFQAGIAEYV
jgi:aminoglycoside 2''-phosphotransferase